MQLSIPSSVLDANRLVGGALRDAHANVAAAQDRLDGASRVPAGTKRLVDDALAAARQAADGVEALGAGNLLDGTFQRYATHSVRDLERAASMLARPGQLGRDAMAILVDAIFDAEVATRLGTAAGDRSLAAPSPRAIERATDFASDTSAPDGGPVWVDGAWLDGLGNPVGGNVDDALDPDLEPVHGGDGSSWDTYTGV